MESILIQKTETYTIFEHEELLYKIKNLTPNTVHCEFDRVENEQEQPYWIMTVVEAI